MSIIAEIVEQPNPLTFHLASECMPVTLDITQNIISNCNNASVTIVFGNGLVTGDITICGVGFYLSQLAFGTDCYHIPQGDTRFFPPSANANLFYQVISAHPYFIGRTNIVLVGDTVIITWLDCAYQPCLDTNTDLSIFDGTPTTYTIYPGVNVASSATAIQYHIQIYEVDWFANPSNPPIIPVGSPILIPYAFSSTTFDIAPFLTPYFSDIVPFTEVLPCNTNIYQPHLLKRFVFDVWVTAIANNCNTVYSCATRSATLNVLNIKLQWYLPYGIEALQMAVSQPVVGITGMTRIFSNMPNGYILCCNSKRLIYFYSQHNELLGFPPDTALTGVGVAVQRMYCDGNIAPFSTYYSIGTPSAGTLFTSYDYPQRFDISPSCVASNFAVKCIYYSLVTYGLTSFLPASPTYHYCIRDCCCSYELIFLNSYNVWEEIPLNCPVSIDVANSFNEACRSVCLENATFSNGTPQLVDAKKIRGYRVINKFAQIEMELETMPQVAKGTPYFHSEIFASKALLLRLYGLGGTAIVVSVILSSAGTHNVLTASEDGNNGFVTRFSVKVSEPITNNATNNLYI